MGDFWQSLQELLTGTNIVIDRPRGQPHPHYPELIYPLDYGYLEGTTSGDGDGIDVWVGSGKGRKLTGILCTFDTLKRDVEIKLLCVCNEQDIEIIMNFHDDKMRTIFIPRP